MNAPYLPNVDTRPRGLTPAQNAAHAALILAMLRGEISKAECLERMAKL